MLKLNNLLHITVAVALAAALTACSTKPGASFVTSQSKTITLASLKGKWVFVNYWADWCKPCIKEMPALEKLAEQNKNNVVVVGVNFDELDNASLNKSAKRFGVTYALTSHFPIQQFGVKDIETIPVTFVFNPEGKLVKTLDGPKSLTDFTKVLR
jgi:thiol-disulfide isomerase/thioredoxin